MAFKQLFSILMSFWFAASPLLANAQTATTAVPFQQQIERMSQRQIHTKTAFKPDYIEVTTRDQNNREQKMQIVRWPEEEIRKFSPKRLAQDFARQMRAAQPGAALMATTKRFPMEASMFFLAIGAVTAFQISTDYSSNPMRMAQHIEHSLSPLGAFSFYMFMATNGVTSQALSTWIKNPKFHHFIPYIGMSAGYFVQSTISTFAADPNVQACVKQQMGADISKLEGIEEDPCEAAFSSYALKSKFYELTPGLISMIGSTFLAWGVERALTQAVFRVTGVNIALWLMPGGVGVSAVRIAVTNAIRMGLFYYIDVVWLNHAVTFSFKNVFDGRSLMALDRELVRRLQKKKESRWADQLTPELCEMSKGEMCERDLAETLKELQKQLSNWRMVNLTRVYEAHMAWQEMLAKINNNYDVTYSFYRDLVEEVRNSRFQISPPYRLDMKDPLFGVTAKDMPEDKAYMYYLRPNFTEFQSSETARDVGRELAARLRGAELQSLMMPQEIRSLQEIATKLLSEDVNVQGQGVGLLNRALNQSLTGLSITQDFASELRQTAQKLGVGAQPLLFPGQSFLARYERWSDGAAALQKSKFPKVSGMFSTAKPIEYLGVQALCGPDVDSRNESVIQIRFGGAGQFTPPRLTHSQASICHGMGEYGAQSSQLMFRIPIQVGSQTYEGITEFLKGEIKPEVLGSSSTSGFNNWWEKKVEPQVYERYQQFGREYENIVAMLIAHWHQKEDSSWNMGPAANGILASLRQQMRLNLLILGEVFKDLHEIQKGQPVPRSLLSSLAEPQPQRLASNVNYIKTAPRSTLLQALRDGGQTSETAETRKSVLEYSRLAPLLFAENDKKAVSAPLGRALHIQKEIEHEFESLIWLISQIQVVEKDGRKRISSKLENADLEAQAQKITSKLEEFASMLGVDEQGTKPGVVSPTTGEVRDVIMNALEDLAALTNEVAMYGSIANAVSWEKLRRLESPEQQEFQNKVQKQVQQLGSSMTQMGRGR